MVGGIESADWIPSHVQRGLYEENIVYLSVNVIYLAVLMRRYQLFLAVIELPNMTEIGVLKYGL